MTVSPPLCPNTLGAMMDELMEGEAVRGDLSCKVVILNWSGTNSLVDNGFWPESFHLGSSPKPVLATSRMPVLGKA